MPKRMAVHVDPRLLSEGLLSELSRRSIELAPVHLPGNDAAVVSDAEGVSAAVVIELIGDNRVLVLADATAEDRSCGSVEELLALIDEFAR